MKFKEIKVLAEKHKKNLDNKFKNISIEVKKLKNEENKKSNNNGESLIQETENNIKKREFSDNMLTSYLDEKQSKKFLQSISTFPHGVLNKNERGDVTTSINLGVVNLKENEFYQEDYLDENSTVIASLIKDIVVNFNYNLNLE